MAQTLGQLIDKELERLSNSQAEALRARIMELMLDAAHGDAPATPARKRAASASKPSSDVSPDAILAYLQGLPDESEWPTSTTLAKQFGTDAKRIKPILDKMIEAGTLSKEGERRGTRYFPAE